MLKILKEHKLRREPEIKFIDQMPFRKLLAFTLD